MSPWAKRKFPSDSFFSPSDSFPNPVEFHPVRLQVSRFFQAPTVCCYIGFIQFRPVLLLISSEKNTNIGNEVKQSGGWEFVKNKRKIGLQEGEQTF